MSRYEVQGSRRRSSLSVDGDASNRIILITDESVTNPNYVPSSSVTNSVYKPPDEALLTSKSHSATTQHGFSRPPSSKASAVGDDEVDVRTASHDDSIVEDLSSTNDGTASDATLRREGFRTTCFDRIPLVVYMLLMLAVPVAIIVALQTQSVVKDVNAIATFGTVEGSLRSTVQCTHNLQLERYWSCFLVDGIPTPATVVAVQKQRAVTDNACNALILDLMSASSVLGQNVVTKAIKVWSDHSGLRARIDANASSGYNVRLAFYTEIFTLVTIIADTMQVPDLAPMRTLVNQLMLRRHWQNAIGQCRAVGSGALLLASRQGMNTLADAALLELAECRQSIQNFETLLYSIADTATLLYYGQVTSNELFLAWNTALNNITSPALDIAAMNYTAPVYAASFTATLNLMAALDQQFLSEIEAAKVLVQNRDSGVVQLVCFELACILATVVVIVMQRRFQRRMDTALGRSQTMSKAVQRFVPRNQLKLMGARSILDVSCGDMVEVASSLLFSDIRDFTTISEGMSQSELFAWLQDYFGQMTRVVEQNRGYVDKFIGDALFCVFTSPTCATQCGVDMQSTVDQLNSRIAADGKLTLVHIGVGIHHGIVAAGVFGDDQRLSCTLVSSDVNLASRLEGVTKVYGARIIISEAVYERIDQERFAMRPLGELQVAGSKMCVSIFEVFQNDVPATKAAKLATRERLQAALELKKTDPAAAVSELAALVSLASELGFEDVALQTKVSHLSRDPTSPDRFGKRGSYLEK